MKKYLLVTNAILFAVLLITACSKDGDPGPEGPKGIDGNANVVQYDFGTHDFATQASVSLGITTTADTMNQSAWYVYLVRSSGNVYPIPGVGVNGSSEYRLYWNYSAGKVNINISRVSGAGEEYSSIRVIRVYANSAVPGGRRAVIDYNDYYAVCRYYGLNSGE
jgi:hypothetical protein